MEIVDWDVKDIRPYFRNPRDNSGAIAVVAEALKKFGWRQPIVVDSDGVIIVGHTRFQAALSLGMETVPVQVASDLTPEQVKEYRLTDNKVGEKAKWNRDLLKLEVAELQAAEITPVGFEAPDINDLLAEKPAEEEKDPDVYGGATALSRGSSPLRFYREKGWLEGRVLDFGAGKEEHHFEKYDMKTHPDITPLTMRYDVVMCNYVLNVQPSDHLIDLILALLYQLTEDDGKVLIAVVSEASLAFSGATGNREHKTPKQWKELLSRFFSVEEMDGGFNRLRLSEVTGQSG